MATDPKTAMKNEWRSLIAPAVFIAAIAAAAVLAWRATQAGSEHVHWPIWQATWRAIKSHVGHQ
ncbi:MAG: hypothetical protein EPN70_16575 [Paraburkholderia sp.]|uniref:hypothetical protein n=1 Tax=Paraburkholderia sp. TaxID=1926495 RepID=UPI001222FB8F|nr:hypothetical protein [Paraburkholderia sp.]TAM02590.1 MAG: hypothetical protein EPN70_16575 [Paraburkholderia sp.]TAM28686.1 MAG: hypothetical protein EPN59_15105 [Paraburkholderia sp.]